MEDLTCRETYGGIEYTFVRPGITLCLLYAEPAVTLAPAVADILEAYIDFIPDGALQTYLSANGTWKKATKRTFSSTLRKLRAVGQGEYAEFHFGQEPPRNVGKFGAHFYSGPLIDNFFPLENGILFLEFPVALSEFTDTDNFLEFVRKVSLLHDLDSGYCGYAFKHLQMSLRREAYREIGKMAMRYIGFDISNEYIMKYARGHVCNISWLTLFGRQIVEKLGGATKIREALPDVMSVSEWGASAMIRASDAPMVGDVNRGAEDVYPLRSLACLTRNFRLEMENLGPDDPDFAVRWLSRFDK